MEESFLLVYTIAMLALGIPLLTMEIAIGEKQEKELRAFRTINKNQSLLAAATTNAFATSTYYAVVLSGNCHGCFSFKFAGMVGDSQAASSLFANITETLWTISGAQIPWVMIIMLLVAWTLIYLCIMRNCQCRKSSKYTGLTLPFYFNNNGY